MKNKISVPVCATNSSRKENERGEIHGRVNYFPRKASCNFSFIIWRTQRFRFYFRAILHSPFVERNRSNPAPAVSVAGLGRVFLRPHGKLCNFNVDNRWWSILILHFTIKYYKKYYGKAFWVLSFSEGPYDYLRLVQIFSFIAQYIIF